MKNSASVRSVSHLRLTPISRLMSFQQDHQLGPAWPLRNKAAIFQPKTTNLLLTGWSRRGSGNLRRNASTIAPSSALIER
jgi:hypothetical protein